MYRNNIRILVKSSKIKKTEASDELGLNLLPCREMRHIKFILHVVPSPWKLKICTGKKRLKLKNSKIERTKAFRVCIRNLSEKCVISTSFSTLSLRHGIL